MKEKIQRFTTGRCGMDEIDRFLMGVTIVLIVLDLLLRSHVLYLLEALCLIWCYYRMLSEGISERFQESQRYLNLEFRVKRGWESLKFEISQVHQFHIYKCPGYGQEIRIPRGEREISIHCPEYQTSFIKRS